MKSKFFLLGVLTIIGLTIIFSFNEKNQNNNSVKEDIILSDSTSHVIIVKNIESIGELMAPAIVICDYKGELKRIPQKMFTETNFNYNLKNLTKVLNDYYAKGYRLVGTTVTGKINYVTEYVLEKK